MKNFKITKGPLEGLIMIEPLNKGCDTIIYSREILAYIGSDLNFIQDNESFSKKGVLRGVHLQEKHPQDKLIRVVDGSIFDVAVDLRDNSSTYGQWFGVELSSKNNKQFFIPKGFAHGFLVLSDSALLNYKVTEYFYPKDELGFAWNDPEIGIEWPDVIGDYQGTANPKGYCLLDGSELIVGEKDSKLPCLKQALKIINR